MIQEAKIKTQHKALLNALDEKSRVLIYSSIKHILQEAEALIIKQEVELNKLRQPQEDKYD